MVLVFDSVYVMDYIYIFAYVGPALIMRDKLFDVLLHLICQYFIEDFHIDIHHGYRPEIFFFSCVSARFWYQDDVGLVNELGRIPSFCIVWNSTKAMVPVLFCTSGRIWL